MIKFRGCAMMCDIATHSLASPSVSRTVNSSVVNPNLTTGWERKNEVYIV